MSHYLHFGLISDGSSIWTTKASGHVVGSAMSPSFDGHTSTTQEATVTHPGADPVIIMVSGSWRCWGPDDQDTDGDDSLHLVTKCSETSSLRYIHDVVRSFITRGRLLDFAILTTEDWSEQVAVCTFGPEEITVTVGMSTTGWDPRPI